MTSPRQIDANRLNSQKSTGPVTAAGQAVSKKNALSHGLTLMDRAQLPDPAKELLDDFENRFRPQCQPKGELEEEYFQAFVWATYQASRARYYEALAEGKLLDEDFSDPAYARVARIAKYRIMHERAAERNFKMLGKLQHDRYCANHPNEVLKKVGLPNESLPASLPVAEIRKHEFKLCNATRVAGEYIHGMPDWKDRPPEEWEQH